MRLAIFFFSLLLNLGAPDLAIENREDLLWDVLTRIAQRESGRRQDRIGIFGEVSEFQLMPATIWNYNTAHGTAYSVEEVRASRILSRMIADWALQWHLWRYDDLPGPLRWALSVSGYHTGYKVTDRGVIRWSYIDDIIPDELLLVQKFYTYKKGRSYMKIKGPR